MTFKELRGKPFEAASKDIIRIDKNEYIIIYKVNLDLNKDIYKLLSKFKDLKELDLQLYISKTYQLLIIKVNVTNKKQLKEECINVSEKMKILNLENNQLNVDDYSEIVNNKINNENNSLEDFNKITENGKYKMDHLEVNNKFFTLMKIREYPNKFKTKDIINYTDISIKFKLKKEDKENKIYNIIREKLEQKKQIADNRVELTANTPIYPFRLKDRLEKINEVKNYNIIGLEINFLIEAESENKLKDKIETIKIVTSNIYNTEILINNIKKETFIEFLPMCIEKDLTIAFFNEKEKFNLRFAKNFKIKKEQNSKNKVIEKTKKNIPGFKKNKDILIKELYENGIVELENNSFSTIYEFKNINYLLESNNKKISILKAYQNFINIINENINVQLYIINNKQNKKKLGNELFIKKNEAYQKYINEYNIHLKSKIEESYNNAADTKYYIILNLEARNIEEAEEENQRLHRDINNEFKSFGSNIKRLKPEQVNELLYTSINQNSNHNRFIINDYDYQLSIDDQILPNVLKTSSDFIQTTNGYKKIYYVKKYPNEMADTFISSLTKLPFNIDVSVHIKTLNPDQGFKKIKNKILSMEANRRDKAKKDQGTGYVPFELENDLVEGYYILDKLSNDDQKLFLTSFYISIYAETKKELQTREKILKNTFAKDMFEFNHLYLRQKEGLHSILPLGKNETNLDRALLTENLTFLHPFSYSNLKHKKGFFYGLNEDNSTIVVDRKRYDNTSAFILGIPGSGKSFITKLEVIDTFFNTDDDIIIIDPEREFGELTKAIGGEVIKLSTSTENFINIMKLPNNTDLSFQDEVKDKIEFLITFLEKLTGEKLTSSEKSILDRCLRKIYQDYKYKNEEPILKVLQNLLKKQKENIAKDLVLKLEIYIEGSLDIFSKKSNVDIDKRVVCFDIKDLREQLKPAALTAILDSTWDRLNYNRERNKFTRLYIDEFYLLARNESSSEWLFEAWKRVRKYRGIPTGITQNIGDLLENHQVATMLSNSEIKVIMNQKEKDRKKLVETLGISELQKKKITDCQAGTGLLIAGNTVMPFNNRLDSKKVPNLYKLISTSHKD